MNEAALRTISRLEAHLRWMRMMALACLCATGVTGWMAYEALHPESIQIGDTVVDHHGVRILDRSGPKLKSTRLSAKGLMTSDQRGYTQISGSELSMHPTQAPSVLEPPTLMFVIDGAPTTNK